jgi:hypothetical protein
MPTYSIDNLCGAPHNAEDFKQGAKFDDAIPWLLAAGHPA